MTRAAVSGFLVGLLASAWLIDGSGSAQQPAAGGAARFTGKNTMLESASSATLRAARGRFEAGARSYWHSHDAGQLIFVQEGRARFQRRGEATRDLRAHESDYTAPNVVHWHGAAPDEAAVMVTVALAAPRSGSARSPRSSTEEHSDRLPRRRSLTQRFIPTLR
jgi:quercetin dioxygenase-like cupin family protein